MADYCALHDIQLLPYGTVAGGFLSDRYLGVPASKSVPLPSSLQCTRECAACSAPGSALCGHHPGRAWASRCAVHATLADFLYWPFIEVLLVLSTPAFRWLHGLTFISPATLRYKAMPHGCVPVKRSSLSERLGMCTYCEDCLLTPGGN
jgi:hypothetical protein